MVRFGWVYWNLRVRRCRSLPPLETGYMPIASGLEYEGFSIKRKRWRLCKNGPAFRYSSYTLLSALPEPFPWTSPTSPMFSDFICSSTGVAYRNLALVLFTRQISYDPSGWKAPRKHHTRFTHTFIHREHTYTGMCVRTHRLNNIRTHTAMLTHNKSTDIYGYTYTK